MLDFVRIIIRWLDLVISLPYRLVVSAYRVIKYILEKRLLRNLFVLTTIYVSFAAFIVYVFAPVWARMAMPYWKDEIQYFDERSRGTAIFGPDGQDLGIFDPRLDSKQDLLLTREPIITDEMTAYPDHKTLPVNEIPPHFWQCLQFHEDRHLGTWLNPHGIDFKGVMKIPFANLPVISKALGLRHGAGGSTLSMQMARSYYSSLPSVRETAIDKIRRKISEWMLAPVIQLALRGEDGNMEPFRRWAANHLPLATRQGGDLYGVELTSRYVFGKPSSELSVAEQYVLASAVNKPIMVLASTSTRINKIRQRNWEYITSKRAKSCAKHLLKTDQQKFQVFNDLAVLGGGVPMPIVKINNFDGLQLSDRVRALTRANPVIRSNNLLPSVRYGARAQMKSVFGNEWRNKLRGIHVTVDVKENYELRKALLKRLAALQNRYKRNMDGDYTLDVEAVKKRQILNKKYPDIIVAAADLEGRIVRYFEAGENAHYFGSSSAIDKRTGVYYDSRETRAIASIGKMLGAIHIANDSDDSLDSKYLDTQAPVRGLAGCKRNRDGGIRRLRRAETVFACSLSDPLINRLVKFGHSPVANLVERFGFNMPPAPTKADVTPAATAVSNGLITGSPRRVHHLASAILASLSGNGGKRLPMPRLVNHFEGTTRARIASADADSTEDLFPDQLIKPRARNLVRSFLSAPLCYKVRRKSQGTLKSLSKWCAARNRDIRLHFAKTGTHTSIDPDRTVDTWIAGGIQFETGAAYSYVIVLGTGNSNASFANRLHSSQIATPLLEILLKDLKKSSARKVVSTRARLNIASSIE